MHLEVAETADCSQLDLKRLSALLKEAFGHQLAGTISLAFVDNATIEELNQKYLSHEGPTDVLSFSLDSEDDPDPENSVGEILVSIEMAKSEAEARSITLFEECFRYCVHGFLHLLGYNDHPPSKAKEMIAEQERIISSALDHES